MRVEHIALWTGDLDRLVRFYVKYFAAQVSPRYSNLAKGFSSRFLTLGDGARLEVMHSSTLGLEPFTQRLGLHHLAISTGSEARVDELTALLQADGYTALSRSRRTGDGYYESVILDPDGNQIELTV